MVVGVVLLRFDFGARAGPWIGGEGWGEGGGRSGNQ